MSENNSILKIENLVSSYGNIKALKGVSLDVNKGEIVALLGANGAGKSTLMKSILGMVRIEEGNILYEGQQLVGQKSHEIVPQGISIVPEGRKIFVEFTVEQNLEIGTYFRERPKSRDQELMEMIFELFPRLKERIKQPAGTLSGGEQQMLAIGRAIMSDQKLLLLDEPSMGLAPLVVEQVFKVVSKIRDMGVTVLLVEQNANMALGVCDRAYIMSTGLITGSGRRDELLTDERLVEAYLGQKK